MAGVTAMLGHPIAELNIDGVEGWSGGAPRTRGRRRGGAKTRKPEAERTGAKPQAERTRAKREPDPVTAEPESDPEPEPESEPTGPTFGGSVVPARATTGGRTRKGRAGTDSKPFGEHTPAFLLRPVKVA